MIRRPPEPTLFPYTRSSDLCSRPATLTVPFIWCSRAACACMSVRSARMPCNGCRPAKPWRSEEHTSELQSHSDLVCRLLLEKKNNDRQRLEIVVNKAQIWVV